MKSIAVGVGTIVLLWLIVGCGAKPHRGSRPTAGEDPNGIRFVDVAPQEGISYVYPMQSRPIRNLEAFGCGCAFLDYDGDGLQDVLLVTKPHAYLYRNRGDGRFEDVTAATGLAGIEGDWKGCAAADYDGDGYLDILLSGYRRLALLRSDRGRRLADVTVAAGLDPKNHMHWGVSAGFMDLAGRGLMDLVILNYVVFSPKEPQFCDLGGGVISGCPPSSYKPEYGEMYENLGNGRFRDVTRQSGMKSTGGKGLDLAFCDVDGAGRMDFYIGNDGMPGDLMMNQGGMRFVNRGEASSIGYSFANHTLAAMAADWADYDRDGKLDLVVPGFSDESFALFHNLGHGLFENTSDTTGLSGPTFKPLAFGAKWLDMDNDGWPDLSFVCGHVYDRVPEIDPLSTFRQPTMLFRNEGGKQFIEVDGEAGKDVNRAILGRGSATGDFDNDGRIDLLVVDYEGPPLLLHNTTRTQNHWITLDLRGAKNRLAYGARVTARSGSALWVADVSPASSYLSSSDPRIHFGLGSATSLDTLTIRWSRGHSQVLRNVAADRIVTVRESDPGERPTSAPAH